MKIERFGNWQRGLYFALRNRGGRPAAAEVLVDLAALDLRGRKLHVEELVERREVGRKLDGDTLRLTVRIGDEETLLLALVPEGASAGAYIQPSPGD